MDRTQPVSLVLSGGIALGSYQGGIYQALQEHGLSVSWIAGSSVGAVNGALIAGGHPGRTVETLADYWLQSALPSFIPFGISNGSMRHAANWLSVLQARLLGSPRHLRTVGPRLTFSGFYDLAPTVAYLKETIDLGRLNSGDIRFTVATTDIETGEVVLFDTGKGDRIGIDHLMASCGFLPEFSPVEIAGRLLGDGGLSVNAPFEPVLDEAEGTDKTIFIVDLYARDGGRPTGLESALARKNAILFGNQTWRRLDIYRRFWQRRSQGDSSRPSVAYLSYLPLEAEAGPEAPFDFSRPSAQDRWNAGFLDGKEALIRLEAAGGGGEIVTAIRRHGPINSDNPQASLARRAP